MFSFAISCFGLMSLFYDLIDFNLKNLSFHI
jgi:hypothetical protein